MHESNSIHAQPLRLEELRAHVGCAAQTDVFPFRAAMRNALYTASFLSASEHFLQTLRPLKSATSSALPQKMHVHVGS